MTDRSAFSRAPGSKRGCASGWRRFSYRSMSQTNFNASQLLIDDLGETLRNGVQVIQGLQTGDKIGRGLAA
ncbi:hypothetical protein [Roseicyclus marinus]|uniref:hypothetical protein n=1 Tax=Roseicyclus marinus TaxID=2161673 RepID=UPI00240F4E6D|nr:hypothetical protein [Roseicyclus marinus]